MVLMVLMVLMVEAFFRVSYRIFFHGFLFALVLFWFLPG